MHQFYFNSETLPECETCDNFLPFFSKALFAFDELSKKQHLKIQKGIVTEKMPAAIKLGKFTFQEVLDSIQNTALKDLAYSYFTKYPIERHLQIDDEEAFLERAYHTVYHIILDNTEYETLYLSYVATQKRFALTVALHDDLKKNELCLLSKDDSEPLFLKNLYGDDANTAYIRKCIETINYEDFSLFEKLKTVLDKPVCSKKFNRNFEDFSTESQKAMLEKFIYAKQNCIKEVILADEKIVRELKGVKNAKLKLYELRVKSPLELRVYFTKSKGKIFLGSIGKKSNPNQSKDIKKAHDILVKQIQQH